MERYNVKCRWCGKFISHAQIKAGEVKFHFVPDSVCGPEESYWEHVKCK